MQVTESPQLRVRHLDQRTRDGESEALAAARRRHDERVDPDQFAVDVDERPAAVPVIDRCVGLYVDQRAVRIRLPRDRADHSHRHGVLQSLGAAECEDQLALADGIVVGERQGGQRVLVDFQKRQINLARHADNRRVNGASPLLDDRPHARFGAGLPGQDHLHASRIADHMGVRHDVAAAVDDDAGAHAPLTADDEIRVGARRLVDRPVARDHDLHDAPGYAADHRGDRPVQLLQGARAARGLLRQRGP